METTSDGDRQSKTSDQNDATEEDDELTRLRKELAKERARGAAAEAQAKDERQLRQKADRQRDEEHHSRIQQQRDMAAAVAALEEERATAARDSSQQHIRGYLAAVDRLNYGIPRLIPPPRTAVQTLSEGAKAKATTSGRTTITNKYYPLKMRMRPELPQACRTAFARIQERLSEQALFPS